MTDKQADEDIVRRVQSGDVEAFGILIERYEGKLTRYARRFLSGIDDIADLLQEIFIKAYVNIKSFDAERNFSPWLYRIAHNEFVNALKKRGRRSIIAIDFQTDIFFPHPIEPDTADRETDKRMLKEAFDMCLSELDEKYREPLILSYFQELGYKEIADVLRIPVSTVGVRLSRGKEILKNMYQKKYGAQQ